MSLRVRLFLLLAGLLALLMGAQWWLIQSLSRDLGTEVSAVAFNVGRELVEAFQESEVESESASDGAFASAEVEMRVLPVEDVQEVQEKGESRTRQRIVHVVRSDEAGPRSPEELEMLAAVEHAAIEKDPLILEVLYRGGTEDDELVFRGPRVMRTIPIPLQSLDSRLDLFRSRLLVGSLVLLALGLALAAMVAHRVSRPLRSLAAAAQRVGDGELGVRVPEGATGEMGATLRAFNLMSGRLAQLESDTRNLREAQHLSELGEVSQGFAHSLRNPLNALGLSVDTLAEEDVEEDQRLALASTARQQIRRVDGALRSFLALASGGGEPEEIDVGVLLQDVTLEAIQDCQGRRQGDEPPPRLEFLAAPELPPLRAIAPEIRSVLQALVVNALEASPAGGRVTLSAEVSSEDRFRIRIQDEGPGLPPAVRDKLFTPHVTTKAHGSGMGLFLAHRIVTRYYDGSLQLEKVPRDDQGPGGTCAVLELGHRLVSPLGAAKGESHHG